MISKTNQEKVRKFFETVDIMQTPRAREVGLLVVKRENLSDISSLAPNSNLVTVIDLNDEMDVESAVHQLADAMRAGRVALLRIYDYLDPKIYNQLHLLAKAGRMEYPKLEERIFVDAAKGAQVILIATDANLEKLNYQNIFDIAGVTERL